MAIANLPPGTQEALAKLFEAEIEKSINHQAVLLSICHYGPCTGPECEACEAVKPRPLPRRVRMWRWVKASKLIVARSRNKGQGLQNLLKRRREA